MVGQCNNFYHINTLSGCLPQTYTILIFIIFYLIGYFYFLEEDLIYPSRLHDLHYDLPFCQPNFLTSKEDKVKKLIADLGNKKNNLTMYIECRKIM